MRRCIYVGGLLVIIAILVLFAASVMFDDEPSVTSGLSTAVAEHRFEIVRDGAVLGIDYCGNGALVAHPAVRRVVFILHGDGRDACGAASATITSAELAGVAGETLVVAPHFLTRDDIDEDEDEDDDSDLLYWSNDGWKIGASSRTSPLDRPWALSSFDVLDQMVLRTGAVFGDEIELVVAGHSAGGQFTNRFAAGTLVAESARFVVANPSSYLYFDSRRWDGSSFDRPSRAERRECRDFDEYKYGAEDLVPYLDEQGIDRLRLAYGARQVIYLLGLEDSSEDHPLLDTSCAADLQGANRLERGTRYFDYLQTVYGSEIVDHQTQVLVPGVGHDVRDMLESPEGQLALFGD